MANINLPNILANGDTSLHSRLSANFDSIIAVINGNIDSENISTNELTCDQLVSDDLQCYSFKYKSTSAFFLNVVNFATYLVKIINSTADRIFSIDNQGDIYMAGNLTVQGQVTSNAGFSGELTGNVTGNVNGNASTANALATQRNINLTGDISGTASFDGSSDLTLNVTYQNQAPDAGLWDGSSKTISTSPPTGGNDGDIWFQVI